MQVRLSVVVGSVLLSLPSCGEQLLRSEKISGQCDGISDAFAQAKELARLYFGDVPVVDLFVKSEDEVRDLCGGLACNAWNRIIVSCGSPTELCEGILHEYGHSASWTQFRDWDDDHERFAEFYSGYVFEACRSAVDP